MSDIPVREVAPETPAPPEAAPAEEKQPRGGLFAAIQSLAGTVVIAVFVITFLVQAFQIPSESMEDTLLIGDYLLVDKVHFADGGLWGEVLPYAPIRRGEIIVFRYPVHPTQHFVKRVVGVPGDHIRLIDKHVFVNGLPIDESHAIFRDPNTDRYRDDFPAPGVLTSGVDSNWWRQMPSVIRGGELTVPPGQYFVLGDNRDESLDSRYWGFVPRANIIGRPLLIYWSLREGEIDPPGVPASRMSRFAYVLLHLLEVTRWDRTFHLIR